mgnify:CR=1 FL=1
MNINRLNKDGFIILKNVLSINDIEKAKKNVVDKKVNYLQIEHHINKNIMKTVNQKLNLNLVYSKYRVRNNAENNGNPKYK